MARRKRIAVFLGEIGREFQKLLVETIRNIACGKGYDVFVFNDFGSFMSTTLFDLGERDVINIPDFSQYEGIISLPDTYDIDGFERLLLEKIRTQTDCPIVSIRNGSTDTYRVVFDNFGTIYEMTNHFLKDHGFTNICYMSGPLSYEDSRDRLDGFKAAMADAGLEVTDDIIIEGDFWKRKSKDAADKFLKAYNGKTQAIICANDYMAMGLIEELTARGVRVPEDIAITGFDEVVEGMMTPPTLTTVAIPILEMSTNAINIIESVNKGEEVPMETRITGDIHKKCSCGCNHIDDLLAFRNFITFKTDEYVNIRRSILFGTDIHNLISEEDKLQLINNYTSIFDLKKTYLCLCTDNFKDDNPYSETMNLHCVFAKEGDDDYVKNIKFPRGQILPDEIVEGKEPELYVIVPVHHKNLTFGYIVYEWDKLSDTSFYAPYAEGIALAYNDLRLQEEFSEFVEIKKQNLLDPLTGLENRRGFEQNLSALMAKNNPESDYISFISCDLDNLKPINDTYGHSEGDYAIKTVGNVLKEAIGEGNICARIGGDEFYAIITSSDNSIHENFINNFYSILDRVVAGLDKEYKIHASIGINTVNSNLIKKAFEHMQVADQRMYEAKKKYKNGNVR